MANAAPKNTKAVLGNMHMMQIKENATKHQLAHIEKVEKQFQPNLSAMGDGHRYKSNIFKNEANEKQYGLDFSNRWRRESQKQKEKDS